MNIHEELDRELLRERWIKWANRQFQTAPPRRLAKRMRRLSARLEDWKPTWTQRNARFVLEMEKWE